MAKYIAVVGSRHFQNTDLIKEFIFSLPKDTIIVSGGARGVDSLAEFYAKKAGLGTLILNAEWDRLGRIAGFVRNSAIVDIVVRNNGEVHAFWDGESKGTLDSLNKSQDAGINVFLHREDGTITNEKFAF